MLSDPGSIVLSTLSGYVSSMLHIGDQLKQQRIDYHGFQTYNTYFENME